MRVARLLRRFFGVGFFAIGHEVGEGVLATVARESNHEAEDVEEQVENIEV